MATARSQKNSKLHDNTPGKHKLRKIYLWNPTTIRLIMETLIHVISMEFCRDVLILRLERPWRQSSLLWNQRVFVIVVNTPEKGDRVCDKMRKEARRQFCYPCNLSYSFPFRATWSSFFSLVTIMAAALWTQVKNSPSASNWPREWITSVRKTLSTKTSPRETAWLARTSKSKLVSWVWATISTMPSTSASTTSWYPFVGCPQKRSLTMNSQKRAMSGHTVYWFGRFTRSVRCLTTIGPMKRFWNALRMTFVLTSPRTAQTPSWRWWRNVGKATRKLDRPSKNFWMTCPE